ncbi:hypothetical protein [Lewinella sp. IMCC34183]|uniref:hypothetical protein n=1 Tax=Lewinella sp. IMCC34183 TaxID=2248762 RepID=UPI000E23B7C6|nr:hypothetical protein [Lewinella sp. IMCC34183]
MFGRLVPTDDLESLQRDSWQLELLITGFALAGMVSGLEEYNSWSSHTLRSLEGGDVASEIARGLLVFANFAYLITLVNFFAHVVIRCLWIGAIGSRSVMGNTVMVRRRLAPKFARFLQRRSGNFDAYIRRLDDGASLVFAFTFLLIIVAVSFLSFTLVLVGAATGLLRFINHPAWAVSVSIGMAVYCLAALVYVADFLTGGYLKRFRWLSWGYYPFYRLLGWITLARLYRPLYYNLLNRRGGRWLVALLIPYLALSLGLLSLEIVPNGYVATAYLKNASPTGLNPPRGILPGWRFRPQRHRQHRTAGPYRPHLPPDDPPAAVVGLRIFYRLPLPQPAAAVR